MSTPPGSGGTPTAGRHVIDGGPGLAGSDLAGSDLEPGTADLTSSAADVVLHEERLRVSTQLVGVERVRISKRIVTTTRIIEVPVRIEQLVITHESLDEPLHEPLDEPLRGQPDVPLPGVSGEDDLITLPGGGRSAVTGDDLVIVLHEEVPEVTLRVVAVERVRVGKRSMVGEQTLAVELAAEAVEVTTSDGVV